MASDVSGDGRVDLIVGNKLGTFVVLNRAGEWSEAAPRFDGPLDAVGTELFQGDVRASPPLDPAEERQRLLVPPGFRVELVASEPQIAKPINLAFDRRGRLWVSCTVEYPYPAPADRQPGDSIKVLEDRDGDGQAEHVTTFAEGLNLPMGLCPVDDGVICFDLPDIVHLRDTDGDGRADQRQRLLGPFDFSRDTHGLCNSFRLGRDGWMYACHGFNNQSRVRGGDGQSVEMHSGNVFRFRLDGSHIEIVTHGQVNPFGMAATRWGDWLTADCHTRPLNLLLPGGHHDSFGRPHDGLGYIPELMSHLHGSTGIAGVAPARRRIFLPPMRTARSAATWSRGESTGMRCVGSARRCERSRSRTW